MRFRGIRFVAADRVRTSAPTTRPLACDMQMLEQDREHRRVARLPRTHEYDQRQPAPINEVVDLRAQTPSRPANSMVTRLHEQILVIREIPLWCEQGSWRAGARD